MIIGTGIDIVELSRIEKLMLKNERFEKKILTKTEYSKFLTLGNKRKVEYLAGRFSAKEAFVKAVGTGIGKSYSWHDIEILNDSSGKPYIKKKVNEQIHLSISHSQFYVVSQVIIERLSS
ncbi:holo-ACP synthase [Alkalihalobacillus trypoxylicola]|uniref:Holo-[acyl-carrier-protein] synthase n=1 Tax=Alkalihalobacillus trypoxylicola TaxID=519424 RepID=A0A162F391_9BACI|nr:holo-ACP synthase [Alkalihalobacillus trypoxylicola]KYG34394.1 4'-phosphopantetheinyl transferase [Alkalihalobacillus trypoxylicola]